MTARDAVIRYLDEVPLMQLATVSAEQPWVASVFFAADNMHELFWISSPNARHSQELQRNDRVAATVALPAPYGPTWQGVQIEGTASEVKPEEIEALFQAYAERFNAHYRLPGLLKNQDENRLYRLKPSLFVLYDNRSFPSEPRQEWRP